MYACIAKTQKGARCRNWAADDSGLCAHCKNKEAVQIVGQPDAVEYKFNINKNWANRLMDLGVEFRERDFYAKEGAHKEHAEKHGRQAYRFRKDVVDSGVPVFGTDGLVNVSVYEVFRELVETYEIVDIRIQDTKPGKHGGNTHMKVLVVYFAHGEAKKNTDAIDELLRFLSSSRWGHCHVWANPPGQTGKVKDTVNISHREQDLQPERALRFANGLWAVQEL